MVDKNRIKIRTRENHNNVTTDIQKELKTENNKSFRETIEVDTIKSIVLDPKRKRKMVLGLDIIFWMKVRALETIT